MLIKIIQICHWPGIVKYFLSETPETRAFQISDFFSEFGTFAHIMGCAEGWDPSLSLKIFMFHVYAICRDQR